MYYYDTRYFLLPLVIFLKSNALSPDDENRNSSFFNHAVKLMLISALLVVFLLTSIRIQLFCCRQPFGCHCRRIILGFGGTEFSVPVTLSLTAILLLPLSAFWNAYLLILMMSVWSDTLHAFFTRFTYNAPYTLVRDEQLPVTHNLTLEEEAHNHPIPPNP